MPYKDPEKRRQTQRAYQAAWRERNPGRATEQSRAFRERERERRAEVDRKYGAPEAEQDHTNGSQQ